MTLLAISGLSLGAAYSSSDRTNEQVAYGKAAEGIGYAGGDKAEAGPWAQNMMQTTFTRR